MNETELLKLAEKELLGEAKKAASRYAVAGPSGWKPCPLKKTNKIFLRNTILQTVASNKIRDRRKEDTPKFKRRERKLLKNTTIRGPNVNNIIFKKPAKSKVQSNETGPSKINRKNDKKGDQKIKGHLKAAKCK